MSWSAGALAQLRTNLPHGGGLPVHEWRRRHQAMIVLLWGSTAGLFAYSLAQGYGFDHVLIHLGPLIPLALLADVSMLGRRMQSLIVALGLMTASAVLVHTSGGLIEAHFAFFVFIVALTIYEDWLPFLVSIGFVLVHHGVYGTLDSSGVFEGHADAPWKWAAIHAGFVAAAGLAGVIAWRFNEDVRTEIQRLAAERQELVDELETMAHEDWLTGMPNRRAWDHRFDLDLERARRAGVPVTIALLDVDGLKRVNDSDGHQAGDRLLKELSAHWLEAIRSSDFIARLGGDEFGVIFYDCGSTAVPQLVERLRSEAIEGSWSIGLATWDGSESKSSLMGRADQALYLSKPSRDAAVAEPA